VSRPVIVALDGHPPDTKSKNAKPKSRLNVGKYNHYFIYLNNESKTIIVGKSIGQIADVVTYRAGKEDNNPR